MSDSARPHRWQPTGLPHPWDSPGKNTGVGCHFLLQWMKVKTESEVAEACPTLSDPMDYGPPGSSVHGIFQARVLEWGAIAFSNVFWVSFKKRVIEIHMHRLLVTPPSISKSNSTNNRCEKLSIHPLTQNGFRPLVSGALQLSIYITSNLELSRTV